jgi:hypothetical protein
MLDFLRQPGIKDCDINSVLEGAIAGYQLEEELKNFKYGIAGLSDLYRATMDRHNDLKIIMTDNELTGGSLRNAFSAFYFKFMGTKACSNTTAAAATIMHASNISDGSDRLVRKALLAGIGLSSQRTDELAQSASLTGSVGHRIASHSDLHNIANHQWIGLLKIVVELMCFDINRAKSFEIARDKMEQCKLSNFTKPSEAMAQFTSMYTDARNIQGEDFMTSYDRFTLLIAKLPTEVEIEIQDHLATHKGIDVLSMEWSEAEDIITDAWGTYERRPAGYYKYRVPQQEKQQERQHSAHPGQMEQPTQDREIKCTRYNEDGTKCDATFTFTVDEQQAYQARNHSDPKSCAKHRKSAGYNANGGPCRKFMAGICENGDQCPYSHNKASDSRELVPIPASHHISNNRAISFKEEIEEIDSDDSQYEGW